jgi:hypothetical protein
MNKNNNKIKINSKMIKLLQIAFKMVIPILHHQKIVIKDSQMLRPIIYNKVEKYPS